jgi:hypothetical protein
MEKRHRLSAMPFIYLGGDEEDRTPGLGIANAALSQLSYIPGNSKIKGNEQKRKSQHFRPLQTQRRKSSRWSSKTEVTFHRDL